MGNGLVLPKPNDAVYYNPSFRIPKTNKTLESVGFDEIERDFLFEAYGKETVLRSLAIYFGAIENSHRDSVGKTNPDEIKSGLVATMESIRTSGKQRTENIIYSGGDIVAFIQDKYATRQPTLRVRSADDRFKLEIINLLIETYLPRQVTVH